MKYKNIQFSVGEQEIIRELQRGGLTEIGATESVIAQKKQLAFHHHHQGNIELARQLLIDLDEWSEEAEKDYQKFEKSKTRKIIIL